MSTRLAGSRPVRDLVLFVARRRQPLAGGRVHLGQDVVDRQHQAAAGHVATHRHPLIEREQVARQVVGLERHRLVERALPVGQVLAGQAEHEVQVEAEARLASPGGRLARLHAGVASAEQLQEPVVEALDAEAETIGARGSEATQFVEVGVARVALQRDLGVWLDVEDGARSLEQVGHLSRRHEARRTAAEEDAVHLGAVVRVARQFGLDRLQVHVDAVEARRLAIEVAVRADRQAEREVDVERQAVGHEVSAECRGCQPRATGTVSFTASE